MFFKASLIGALTTLTALSQAASIPRTPFDPRTLVDGHYTASINEDGTLSDYTLVEALVSRSINPAAEVNDILKRVDLPNPQTGCTNNAMDKSTNGYGNAYNNLVSWCNNGNVVSRLSAQVFVSNSAIAYICNYGNNNPCTGDEFRDANILIDNNCGAPNSGWVLLNDWAKGYGRDNRGVAICSWGQSTK